MGKSFKKNKIKQMYDILCMPFSEIPNTTFVDPPVEAPMSQNIGIVAAIVLSLTIGAFIIIDIPALIRDFNTMAHNIKFCQTVAVNVINRKYYYIPCEELKRRRSTWL